MRGTPKSEMNGTLDPHTHVILRRKGREPIATTYEALPGHAVYTGRGLRNPRSIFSSSTPTPHFRIKGPDE